MKQRAAGWLPFAFWGSFELVFLCRRFYLLGLDRDARFVLTFVEGFEAKWIRRLLPLVSNLCAGNRVLVVSRTILTLSGWLPIRIFETPKRLTGIIFFESASVDEGRFIDNRSGPVKWSVV
jgi:hypothetical protein